MRDDDKWTGPRTVGRTSLAGRDVADGVGGVATLDWRPLAPEPAVDRGHLLVGLSFLPTSQRILLHVDQLKLGRSAAAAADGRCLLVRLLLLNEFGRVNRHLIRQISREMIFFFLETTVDSLMCKHRQLSIAISDEVCFQSSTFQ